MIKNLITGSELYLGSTCIFEFNIPGTASIKESQKRQRSIKKYSDLIQIFPTILDDYISARSIASSTMFVLPSDLEKYCTTAFREVRKLADQFLIADTPEEKEVIIQGISEAKNTYNKTRVDIVEFENSQKGNPLAIYRSDIKEIKELHGEAYRNFRKHISGRTSIDEDNIEYFINKAFLERFIMPSFDHVMSTLGYIGKGVRNGLIAVEQVSSGIPFIL